MLANIVPPLRIAAPHGAHHWGDLIASCSGGRTSIQWFPFGVRPTA